MKMKPRAQSNTLFIKASQALSTPSTLTSVAGLVERLEPLNGISMGKEIEANLIMLSEKKIADLDNIEGSSCIIIGVELIGQSITLEESFQELSSLMAYSGLSIIGSESQKSAGITHDHIFGQGKIMEIASQLISTSSHTVIFDGELSAIQLKNLEDSLLNELPSGMKRVNVLDKTAIILDIIAQNSKSAESAMQAELAILLYRLPRMTRMWRQYAKPVENHLCVGCRGPGNKRIDLDFKYMRKRISCLKETLNDIRNHRTAQRHSRKSKGLPSIAIVGYANSGKTTLLRALSDNSIPHTEARLDCPFKTLEAVTRRVSVPKHNKYSQNIHDQRTKLSITRSVCPDFLLTDTLSFIHDLPKCIQSAFQMNFDEICEADILINVCDISNPMWQEHEKSVLTTLNKMENMSEKPLITLWNRLDRFSEIDIPKIQQEASHRHQTVALSALSGLGFEEMLHCLNRVMVNTLMCEVSGTLCYTSPNLALLSKLQQTSSFKLVEYTNEGIRLVGKIPLQFATQFEQSISTMKEKSCQNMLINSLVA